MTDTAVVRAPLGALALLCLFAAAPAGAQPEPPTLSLPAEAPAAPAPAAADAPGPQIAEIIVTAQKKAQNLQDVPVSVGVLSGDTLRESGNSDVGALENFVANVQIDTDPQAPVIGIRGFSTETDNVGFESSVGLVMDDLALARPEFVPDGLYDLQRIEVLRGSQGTLFGKNTVAGVINFATQEARPEDSGYLLLSSGGPRQVREEGAVNLALSDWLSARAAGTWWNKQGDVQNSTLDRKEGSFNQGAGRLRLLATPGERWRISLLGQYSHTHADYSPWQLFDATPEALAYARSYDASAEDSGTDAHTTANTPGYVKRTSNLQRALIDYELGEALGAHEVKLTTVLGHAAFKIDAFYDIDTTASDIVNTVFTVNYHQNSIELRPSGRSDSLLGFGGEVDWTLGLYYFRSDLGSHFDTLGGDNLVDFALSGAGLEALGLPGAQLNALLALLPNISLPLNDSLLRGFAQQAQSYAAFGQMSWKLGEQLSAIFGLRLGQDRKQADFDVTQTGIGLISNVVGATPFAAHLERRENDFSPKAGLQYRYTPALMGFLTYTRGFKGGGFNATADNDHNLEFEPERAGAWETGFKSQLFARSLMFNLTLYRTDIRNLQVVDLTGTEFAVSNAAEARLQGVESEILWQAPWPWLSVVSSMAYGTAEYTSYHEAPAPAYDSGGQQDLSGKTLAHAPRLTASLSPNLKFPLGEALAVSLGVDYSYRSGQYSAIDLDEHSHQSGYGLWGAHLGVQTTDERWQLQLAGNNLTDKRALDLVFDHAVFANSYGAVQTPLRSVTASLRYNW